MSAKRRARSEPWITEEGFFDPGQFPIDSVLKQVLSEDRRTFRSGVSLLRSMCNSGRTEAGVFLLGLLRTCGDNWEKRIAIVGALYDMQTQACVDALFSELRRVKSTNSTRRYLKELIEVLSCMPPVLVRSGFESLARDKSFTHRMRAKFDGVLDDLDYRERYGPSTAPSSP